MSAENRPQNTSRRHGRPHPRPARYATAQQLRKPKRQRASAHKSRSFHESATPLDTPETTPPVLPDVESPTSDVTEPTPQTHDVSSPEQPPDATLPEEKPRAPRSINENIMAAANPRASTSYVLIAVLCGLLGFAMVAQIGTHQHDNLEGLRQSELLSLLDEATERRSRLDAEITELERSRDELTSDQNNSDVAQRKAQDRLDTLGILAGNAKAQGPGIRLVISDSEQRIKSHVLVNTVQELRAAGAEAIDLNGVRVVAQTAIVVESSGNITVDGQQISSPYTFSAIGDPKTLEPALNIPGGVIKTVERVGASATVTILESVTIESLRNVRLPEYARPADN